MVTDSLINFFFDRVARNDNGCWEWLGKKSKLGYGQINRGELNIYAHRFSHFLFNDNIMNIKNDKMHVCHTCDNPSCVNPSHLFTGNQLINMQDKTAKGRHHYKKRSHCKNGHEFNEDNTRIDKKGARRCKQCARESWRKWKQTQT